MPEGHRTDVAAGTPPLPLRAVRGHRELARPWLLRGLLAGDGRRRAVRHLHRAALRGSSAKGTTLRHGRHGSRDHVLGSVLPSHGGKQKAGGLCGEGTGVLKREGLYWKPALGAKIAKTVHFNNHFEKK